MAACHSLPSSCGGNFMLFRFLIAPKQSQSEKGNQRHATGNRESEVERTGLVDQPAIILLRQRRRPGRNSANAGNLALMMRGNILCERVVNRKNAEGACAHKQ